MYLQHFGLLTNPFSLTPDTGFFFDYASHHDALETLTVTLREGEGFLKVTGPVGVGKTMLCRLLLNHLDDTFVTAYIPNPLLTPQALHVALAEELEVETVEGASLHHVVKAITRRLIELRQAGKQVVVLVDEAQAMPDETLETLRLITNLETETDKLLQVVLFGQVELDERLAAPQLRQLRQRITFAHHLQPLDREALEGYVIHRLAVAGYNGRPLFKRGALKALFHASEGIPRLINIVGHKALLAAYGEGVTQVDTHHVQAAVRDTEGVVEGPGPALLPWAGALLLAAAALLYLFNDPAAQTTLRQLLP